MTDSLEPRIVEEPGNGTLAIFPLEPKAEDSLFNRKDENQIYMFLPNPFLSDDVRFLKQPDWSRLALWDDLRQRHLGLPPDPKDQSGKTMFHR